ncbi:MAG: hypothetical protein HY731_10375, partial [Candidatus Tectomicrobia bacterium]|nr:hypothetical protein [Candidatus Tectomicrobia bacterium]
LSLTATDAVGNTSAPTEVTIIQSTDLPLPGRGEATIINVVSGNNQEGVVGEPLPQLLEVIVTDPEGDPIAGKAVVFQAVMGGSTFEGASTVTILTDRAGKAAVSLTLGLEPGLNMVRANFAGNQNLPAEFMATGLAPRPLAETRLSGVVLAIDLRAIPGVTVIFEGREANAGVRLETRTNEKGAFAFFNVPPGNNQRLLVHGDTATLDDGPYAALVFDIDVLPGQNNKTGRHGGRGGPIFLPRVTPGVEIPLDAAGVVLEDRVVELDTEAGPIILRIPQGTRVTFPEGVEHRVSVLRVPINRLPMPLPEGQFSRTVIAIAPAETRFDPPLPISFPNMDGAPPGTRVRLISFDHDAGQFVEVGGATVSADGSRLESDPGVGIRVGAWHATPPNPRSLVSTICAEQPPESVDLDCECWASSSQPALPMGGRIVCATNVPAGISMSGIRPDAQGTLPDSIVCICNFRSELKKTINGLGAEQVKNAAFPVGQEISVVPEVVGVQNAQVEITVTQQDGVTTRGTVAEGTAFKFIPTRPGIVTVTSTSDPGTGTTLVDTWVLTIVDVKLLIGAENEDDMSTNDDWVGANGHTILNLVKVTGPPNTTIEMILVSKEGDRGTAFNEVLEPASINISPERLIITTDRNGEAKEPFMITGGRPSTATDDIIVQAKIGDVVVTEETITVLLFDFVEKTDGTGHIPLNPAIVNSKVWKIGGNLFGSTGFAAVPIPGNVDRSMLVGGNSNQRFSQVPAVSDRAFVWPQLDPPLKENQKLREQTIEVLWAREILSGPVFPFFSFKDSVDDAGLKFPQKAEDSRQGRDILTNLRMRDTSLPADLSDGDIVTYFLGHPTNKRLAPFDLHILRNHVGQIQAKVLEQLAFTVNLHLLRGPKVNSGLTSAQVVEIMKNANKIWLQAGVSFKIKIGFQQAIPVEEVNDTMINQAVNIEDVEDALVDVLTKVPGSLLGNLIFGTDFKEEDDVTAVNNSTDAIDIYFVHFLFGDGQETLANQLNGSTILVSQASGTPINPGILIAGPFAGGSLPNTQIVARTLQTIARTVAHELGHYLMDVTDSGHAPANEIWNLMLSGEGGGRDTNQTKRDLTAAQADMVRTSGVTPENPDFLE